MGDLSHLVRRRIPCPDIAREIAVGDEIDRVADPGGIVVVAHRTGHLRQGHVGEVYHPDRLRLPDAIGSGVSLPPATGTFQSRTVPTGTPSRPEKKRTFAPSGVQPATASAPGCQVSRFGSPPSALTTNTSGLPP